MNQAMSKSIILPLRRQAFNVNNYLWNFEQAVKLLDEMEKPAKKRHYSSIRRRKIKNDDY
jgi:hypothetical protein